MYGLMDEMRAERGEGYAWGWAHGVRCMGGLLLALFHR